MKKSLIVLSLLAGFAGSANASELSYSFIEADYVNLGDFGGAESFDGFGVRGSIAFGENFYGLASYNNTSANPFGVNIDIDLWNVGLGFKHSINDKADFFADASYSDASVSCFGCSDPDGSGYTVNVGFRGNFNDHFEGSIAANHRDLSDFGSDTSLALGAQFKFNETWGITANTEFGGDDNRYSIGVRASF